MGHFSLSCSASGLPIGGGDPCMAFLLVEDPYGEPGTAPYFPRTIPFRALYNSYGNIEKYNEADPAVASIMPLLSEDIIEKGVGDNTYHDRPVSGDMKFCNMVDALVSNRITIERHTRDKGRVGDEGDRHFPSMKSVTVALEEAGLVVNKSGKNNFNVDKMAIGWVRVRYGEFAIDEKLLKKLKMAKDVLDQHYATVITSGSGRYSDGAELQVFPTPATQSHIFLYEEDERKKPLGVKLALIREDVWKNYSSSWFVDKVLNTIVGDNNTIDPVKIRHSDGLRLNPPFSIGLLDHLLWIQGQEKFTPQQFADAAKNAAILVSITFELFRVRRALLPAHMFPGPQESDFYRYKPFIKMLSSIVKKESVGEYREKDIWM